MRFMTAVDTDAGISKRTNQDSVLLKHAVYDGVEVLLAVVCDGMGGLSKGELASATVIREFSNWFDESLAYELENADMQVIAGKWSLLLKDLNLRIGEYGNKIGSELGTTFSGILFIGDQYLIVHVGDSRIYHIGNYIRQLTADQTFVAREVERGTMSPEQAKLDKRRNLLLQCVGASEVVEPQVICGRAETGVYMLCSDGFCNKITEDEMFVALAPVNLHGRQEMRGRTRYLIEQAKARKEQDNISAIVIKVDQEVGHSD